MGFMKQMTYLYAVPKLMQSVAERCLCKSTQKTYRSNDMPK